MSSAGQDPFNQASPAFWDLLNRCRSDAAAVVAGLTPEPGSRAAGEPCEFATGQRGEPTERVHCLQLQRCSPVELMHPMERYLLRQSFN